MFDKRIENFGFGLDSYKLNRFHPFEVRKVCWNYFVTPYSPFAVVKFPLLPVCSEFSRPRGGMSFALWDEDEMVSPWAVASVFFRGPATAS